jgi:hypothetical protein
VLSGLAVFVLMRAFLALFHAWELGLHLDVVIALQTPMTAAAASGAPASVSDAPRRSVRRARPPAPREGSLSSLRSGAVFAACLLGSVLFHSAIVYVAQHVDSSANAPKVAESDGVFHASLVARAKEPELPRVEVKLEPPPAPPEPPVVPPPPPPPPPAPPPPPPPPVPQEVVVPPPPKPEPEVRETPVAQAKPGPEKEEPKPAAPPEPAPKPPPPAPVQEREAAPEPPAPAAPKVKETATAAPEPVEQTRYTETPKATEKTPEPATAPTASEVRSPAVAVQPPTEAPASSGEAPPALGLGPKPQEAPAAPPKGSAGEISTVGDYRRFLSREMKAGAAEGQYVPNLRFGDNKPEDNREIMRYFGMELIAYPKDQKFYVYIEPEQGLFSRSNDFSYIRNFSTRVIFRTSPYFDSLRTEAARRAGVDASSLVVAQLLKPSSAAYIGWKERECAKRVGVVLEDVDACEATFVKSPFGAWIVRIDRLLLRNGQDFEWARVSNGKGGGS